MGDRPRFITNNSIKCIGIFGVRVKIVDDCPIHQKVFILTPNVDRVCIIPARLPKIEKVLTPFLFSVLKISVGVHAFVKNTNYQNILLTQCIKYYVAFMQETAIPVPNIVHRTAHFGVVSK